MYISSDHFENDNSKKYDHKNKIAKNPYSGRNDPRTMLLDFDLAIGKVS